MIRRLYWSRRWRVPLRRLRIVTELPPARADRIHLAHHVAGDIVAEFNPRTGRARPRFRLADASGWHEPRVRGRYQPLRSGVIAYYRDDDGQVVIQHRHKKVLAPPDAWRSVRGHVFRRLAVGRNLNELDHLRVVDAEGRAEGPLWMRLFDFTWKDDGDFDLVEAIAHDTWHDEHGRMPLV